MDATDDLSLSTQEARCLVAVGLDPELASLRRFRLRRRLLDLLLFPLLWVVAATCTLTIRNQLDPGWPRTLLMCLGVFVSAVSLNAFVLILHEGMHHTLVASPFWNRWLSFLYGLPVLVSFSAYQVMHLRHHTFLGDPRDPDDYANYTKSRVRLWVMHFLRLAFGAFLYLLLIPYLALKFGNRAARRRVLEEYALLLPLLSAAIAFVPGDILLWGWFLPVVLTGYMTNIRGFTQHGITDAHDPFLASRTMRPHPLVAFCLLNENYHLEHHLFPEVPSYHLHRLHELLWPRLPRAVTGSSYVAFLARFLRATLTLDDRPIGYCVPEQAPPAVTAPEHALERSP